MKPEPLKILIVCPEASPYAKSGGLGEVMGSLPPALSKLGLDVRVVIPKFRGINNEKVPGLERICVNHVRMAWRRQYAGVCYIDGPVKTYFIENDFYFDREGYYGYGDDHERFTFFCKAVLDMLPQVGFVPDIIHLNDWQTAPIALYLKEGFYHDISCYESIKTLFTIHNLQYQGMFPKETLHIMELSDYYFHSDRLEFYGKVNFMKAGLIYSNALSTVSPTYAEEIQRFEYGYGMDGILRMRHDCLYGILNGIDVESNNPATDARLYAQYTKDDLSGKKENKKRLQEELRLPVSDAPMMSIISRLVEQKGMDMLAAIIEELLNEDIQLVILGTGDERFEDMFKSLTYRYPGKVSANIRFDEVLAQRIYAASDMFIMPSLFEPCGLGQMFSLRYGTIPIARKTGGLNDTITQYDENTGQGNGFLFASHDGWHLYDTICYAIKIYWQKEAWAGIVKNAMACDFSWETSAKSYLELYQTLKTGE